MNIDELMTGSPRSCRPEEPLSAAARLLWDHDCGAVPVVDGAQRPVGIVTDRDCCMAAYTRGQRLDQITVHDAMAKTVFTVRRDEPVARAAEIMRERQVRRLPVVDAAGRLCGIVALADLLRRADALGAGNVLAAAASVSAPRRASPAASAVVVPASRPAAPPAPPVVAAAKPMVTPAPTPPAATAAAAGGKGKDKHKGKKK